MKRKCVISNLSTWSQVHTGPQYQSWDYQPVSPTHHSQPHTKSGAPSATSAPSATKQESISLVPDRVWGAWHQHDTKLVTSVLRSFEHLLPSTGPRSGSRCPYRLGYLRPTFFLHATMPIRLSLCFEGPSRPLFLAGHIAPWSSTCSCQTPPRPDLMVLICRGKRCRGCRSPDPFRARPSTRSFLGA